MARPTTNRAGASDPHADCLFDVAPVGLVVLDDEGRLVRSNPAYRRLLGLAEDPVGDVLPVIGGTAEVLRSAESLAARPGERSELELRLRRGDGSELWTWITVSRLPEDAEGALVVGVEDLSADVELRVELAARRDEAIEQSRRRAEFVARVSHELRNQIHALHGLTELLSSDGVPRSVRGLASSALRQAQQFEHLVEDLLDYSRMEAGSQELTPTPTWPRQLVADAVHLARSRARVGVEVDGHTDEAVPDVVRVDAPRVRQVLANLVMNAAKFTEAGAITVTLRNREVDGGPGLELSVRDTGCGIPPEDLERIFRPFERASTGSAAGTGLGLSITEKAVQLLGGRIEVESRTGRGATFSVVLPVAPAGDDEVPAPAATSSRTSVQPGLRVLVVEDNEVNQLLVAEQLRRLGASSTVVGTGLRALEHLAEGEPVDCVLMDWQLPGIDGVETTRRIRAAEPADTRLPIIGVTASAMPADRRTCMEAGMDDLLVKPVGLRELAATLSRWTSAPTGVPDEETADVGALDRLVEDLGSVGPVRSIVETYLVELEKRSELIERGAADGDTDLVRRTAHTLRSTSRTLGAIDIDRVAATIEEGEVPPPEQVLDEFRDAARRTRAALSGWLDQVGSDPVTAS